MATKKKGSRKRAPDPNEITQIAVGRTPAAEESTLYALTLSGDVFAYGVDEEGFGNWTPLSGIDGDTIVEVEEPEDDDSNEDSDDDGDDE